jgi:hypothetical protein
MIWSIKQIKTAERGHYKWQNFVNGTKPTWLPTRPSKAGKGELSQSSELKLERIETTLSKIEKNTKSRIEPQKKKKTQRIEKYMEK